MNKYINGFRGFLGYYFGSNTKLYMETSGIIFYMIVILLGGGGIVFGAIYCILNALGK